MTQGLVGTHSAMGQIWRFADLHTPIADGECADRLSAMNLNQWHQRRPSPHHYRRDRG